MAAQAQASPDSQHRRLCGRVGPVTAGVRKPLGKVGFVLHPGSIETGGARWAPSADSGSGGDLERARGGGRLARPPGGGTAPSWSAGCGGGWGRSGADGTGQTGHLHLALPRSGVVRREGGRAGAARLREGVSEERTGAGGADLGLCGRGAPRRPASQVTGSVQVVGVNSLCSFSCVIVSHE